LPASLEASLHSRQYSLVSLLPSADSTLQPVFANRSSVAAFRQFPSRELIVVAFDGASLRLPLVDRFSVMLFTYGSFGRLARLRMPLGSEVAFRSPLFRTSILCCSVILCFGCSFFLLLLYAFDDVVLLVGSRQPVGRRHCFPDRHPVSPFGRSDPSNRFPPTSRTLRRFPGRIMLGERRLPLPFDGGPLRLPASRSLLLVDVDSSDGWSACRRRTPLASEVAFLPPLCRLAHLVTDFRPRP
jgi:hypothetical protein